MTHREEAFVQPVPRCSLPLGAHVTQHNLGSRFSGGLQSLNPPWVGQVVRNNEESAG